MVGKIEETYISTNRSIVVIEKNKACVEILAGEYNNITRLFRIELLRTV